MLSTVDDDDEEEVSTCIGCGLGAFGAFSLFTAAAVCGCGDATRGWGFGDTVGGFGGGGGDTMLALGDITGGFGGGGLIFDVISSSSGGGGGGGSSSSLSLTVPRGVCLANVTFSGTVARGCLLLSAGNGDVGVFGKAGGVTTLVPST